MSLLQERASTEELHDLARELDGRPVPQLRMTEADFESWCDEDIKAEWVDGEVIVMAPVSGEHADLSLWLLRLVSEVVDSGNFGVVRGPEFQVRLGAQRRRRTPDLFFVTKARTRMLRRTYLDGAPDLIMEVVSPDSESRDWRDKYIDYQSAAVREY